MSNLFIFIIVLIFVIIIQLIISSWFVEIAKLKGYNAKEHFIFQKCFWLGLPGWLYTLGLPDIRENPEYDNKDTIKKSKIKLQPWTCSQCGQSNPGDSAVCSKCSTVNYDMWHKLHE